ncbi:hypothetical protein PtB15_16B194 [Puccinia triticina]|nr:hypothetical protein PtB15_16B194 [Puccinia triticina]
MDRTLLPFQSRPPLPSGSPSAASRFARHPQSPLFRLAIARRPPLLAPGSTSCSTGLHPRPPTPFHARRSDHLAQQPSASHTRSFSYDDQSLAKDRTMGSSAYTDLDDIIGRSVSSHRLDPACSESSRVGVPDHPAQPLSLPPAHQRSLSVPATPVDRSPARVRFERAMAGGSDRLADRRPPERPSSPGATPTNTTGSPASTELPAGPSAGDLYHPLPPDAIDSQHSARPSSPHPQPPPPPSGPSTTTLGDNQQPDVKSTHQQLPPSTTPTDLPPQVFPGKLNPLLPPPAPAPRSARQISFPRPFRRSLSLEPSAVQLPPSPPPEFDFSSFDNPPAHSASSSLLYSLLDDSPCMSNHHSTNHDLSGRPLIDLTDGPEEPTGTGKSQRAPHDRQRPTRTPFSHFTPLSSPVISERPFLSSVLSSPPTEYIPSRYRNRPEELSQHSPRQNQNGSELSEILRSLDESISNREPTQKTAPVGEHSPSRRSTPHQPSSDHTASGPTERQTAHRSASHTPRNQSSSRGHSKPASFPPSPAPVDRAPTATVASSKRSHSRAPSVHWSVHHSPAARSGTEPLTEEALRLHQSSEQILSGKSLPRSQAGSGRPGGDVAASPRPTDVESRVTRWEAGEPKDEELASLVESINQRNEARSQELTGLLRAVSRGIQEHDRLAEAETAMVRELSRSRQSQLGRGSPRDLGELAGEECGGSQFSAPFGSPVRTLHQPTSIRDGTFSPALEPLSHLHSHRPSLAGDMTTNIREASVAASLHAQSLMDNIRASRASSIRASVRAAEMASNGPAGQDDAPKPGSVAGTAKAASVAGTAKAASVAGTAKAASVAGTAKAASVAGTAKAPSAAGTVRAPSEAGTVRAASVAGSTKARSTRTAASLHEPSAAPQPSAPASRAQSIAPSQPGTMAAPSNHTQSRAPSVRDPSRAASLREPSVAGNSQNPGAAGSAKAPSVAGTAKVGSVAGSVKAPSACGTPKAGSIAAASVETGSVAGTAKAPSVAGSRAGSAAGTVKAPSVAGSVRPGTVAPSVRAPTEVVEEQEAPPASERAESVAPPTAADEEAAGGDGGEGGGDGGEGEAAPADDAPGEEQPAGDDPPAPADDTLVKSGPPTLVGTLAGEIIGGDQPVQEEDGHKVEPMLKRPIVPTAHNPLGEWIRFGRAGFKFHILDPSPPPELDDAAAKLP